MKNLKSEILKSFEETKFAKGGGSCFECSDYEGMYVDLKSFLSESMDEIKQGERERLLANICAKCRGKLAKSVK